MKVKDRKLSTILKIIAIRIVTSAGTNIDHHTKYKSTKSFLYWIEMILKGKYEKVPMTAADRKLLTGQNQFNENTRNQI